MSKYSTADFFITPSKLPDEVGSGLRSPVYILQPIVYNRRYERLHHATRLQVGGWKNSTCLILATLHPTGCKYVNMSVCIIQPVAPTGLVYHGCIM
jgi:hypothetical protein